MDVMVLRVAWVIFLWVFSQATSSGGFFFQGLGCESPRSTVCWKGFFSPEN